MGLSGAGAVSGKGGQNVPGRVACLCTGPRLVQLRVQWGSLWWVASNACTHFADYFLLLGAAGWG